MIKLTPPTGVLLGLSVLTFETREVKLTDNFITLSLGTPTLSERWAEAILNRADFRQSNPKLCMYGTLCQMMGLPISNVYCRIPHLRELAGVTIEQAREIYSFGAGLDQPNITREEAAEYIRSLNLP